MKDKGKSEARKRNHGVCSTELSSKNAKLGFRFELFGSTKIWKIHFLKKTYGKCRGIFQKIMILV